ncbi:hypothetical protein DXG01_015762 [Tephrocybe rancida]|nr:hypothetical protein DXG01_015762 [Tephrocybe rancida]
MPTHHQESYFTHPGGRYSRSPSPPSHGPTCDQSPPPPPPFQSYPLSRQQQPPFYSPSEVSRHCTCILTLLPNLRRACIPTGIGSRAAFRTADPYSSFPWRPPSPSPHEPPSRCYDPRHNAPRKQHEYDEHSYAGSPGSLRNLARHQSQILVGSMRGSESQLPWEPKERQRRSVKDREPEPPLPPQQAPPTEAWKKEWKGGTSKQKDNCSMRGSESQLPQEPKERQRRSVKDREPEPPLPPQQAPPTEARKKERKGGTSKQKDNRGSETPKLFGPGERGGPSGMGAGRRCLKGPGSPEVSSNRSGSSRSVQPSPTSASVRPPSRALDEDYDKGGVTDALMSLALPTFRRTFSFTNHLVWQPPQPPFPATGCFAPQLGVID